MQGMSAPNEASPLGTKKLAQVAIVVKDIDAAAHNWAELLGVRVPEVIETAEGEIVNMSYRGEPSSAKARLAFFDLGGVQLELIEPIGSESAWFEGLPEKGERLHHIAFWTDDMHASAAELEEHHVPLIHRGDMGDGQYAYFDAQDQLGAVIELLEHKRTPL
jgi:catechol 2,3-dioxygenase-like lactoylglutathione lyase family enzyme